VLDIPRPTASLISFLDRWRSSAIFLPTSAAFVVKTYTSRRFFSYAVGIPSLRYNVASSSGVNR
jgi:hypothetical protein